VGEAAAHVVGRDAHDRVCAGVVVAAAMEDIDAEQPLFQAGRVSCQGVVDQVLQQLGGAAAGGEIVAGEDDVEVLAYLRVVGRHRFLLLRFSLFALIRLGQHA
jgi:hypothetical protein